ncbi:MAG: DUF362 domain-containing protein [bacterium]|nr:DUF362 domain-containing protein [bacterium]
MITAHNSPPASQVVVMRAAQAAYPQQPPFHPPERYPELAFLPVEPCDSHNAVYPAVRAALLALGTAQDNPLGWLVRPGDTVVLKPNFIREGHETRPWEWQQVITHGAVIRAVCDYVLLALQGRGRVVICDAPQTDSSFEEICARTGVYALAQWYQRWSPVPVDVVDLRAEAWRSADGVVYSRQRLPGDPRGYVALNLGKLSYFHGITPPLGFYGADYDTEETQRHHHDDVHEYLLARTVMDADVLINLPKLKTHKKTGFTCALKNLVGINGNKNWLPHYMLGTPEEGGDQFPLRTMKACSERLIVSWFKRRIFHAPAWLVRALVPLKQLGRIVYGDTQHVIRSGNWHGNDTTWRMALDLNLCWFYFDPARQQFDPTRPPRRYLAVVDGIIAGEGNGPMAPDAKPCGVVLAGTNPVSVDTVCAWLMGFDPHKLRLLTGAYERRPCPLTTVTPEELLVCSNEPRWQGTLGELDPHSSFRFTPHFGWRGVIERIPSEQPHVRL